MCPWCLFSVVNGSGAQQTNKSRRAEAASIEEYQELGQKTCGCLVPLAGTAIAQYFTLGPLGSGGLQMTVGMSQRNPL